MRMNRRTTSFRPGVENLEDRCTPAGTVTGVFSNGTWTLTGDELDNEISINATGTPNQFAVTGNDGETLAGITTASNVKNIVVKLRAGDDRFRLNSDLAPTSLAGSLTIDGGAGDNAAFVLQSTIGQHVTVTNGAGDDEFELEDSVVKGNVTITNGDGGSDTEIVRESAGLSFIGGSLRITNGSGFDRLDVADYHIGGDVVVKNGLPNGDPIPEAGYAEFYNDFNTTARSVYGGDVRVSYQGNGEVQDDGLWDIEVLGDVRFNYGSSEGRLLFDGYHVGQPVLIHGGLTVKGDGPMLFDVASEAQGFQRTGLVVGQNLSITTGNQIDTVTANRLRVDGITTINTAGGKDTIAIDDSHFHGLVTILTGGGEDVVNIETTPSTSAATQVVGALKIDLGDNGDALNVGIAGDATGQLQAFAKVVALSGAGNDVLNNVNLLSVFGKPVQTDF